MYSVWINAERRLTARAGATMFAPAISQTSSHRPLAPSTIVTNTPNLLPFPTSAPTSLTFVASASVVTPDAADELRVKGITVLPASIGTNAAGRH